MNNCIFIGNLGQNPEIKTTESGMCIATFSMAIADFKKGEKKTAWINVTAFDKTAETIKNYVKKGSKLAIEAKFQIDEYEKDGQKKKKYYFIANRIELLTSKSEESQNNNTSYSNGNDCSQVDSTSNVDKPIIDEDELPF